MAWIASVVAKGMRSVVDPALDEAGSALENDPVATFSSNFGYISVDRTGTVVTAGSDAGGPIGDRLSEIAGRDCPAFTPAKSALFGWHERNVFRGA